MAPKEPSTDLRDVASTNESQDDTTNSAKSNEKRHSTQSHSSSGSEDTEATDDDSSKHHNVYNDAESLAEARSISKVESRAMTKHATNKTGTSVATTTDPNFEVDFEDGDPADPHNWPFWYRCLVIFFVSFSTLTV